MDKKILENEQELAEERKRPAPLPDDLDDDQPRGKKAKLSHERISLLEKMAHGDKQILVKQEEQGELDPLPEITPAQEEEDYYARGFAKIAENLKAGNFDNRGGERKGKGKGKSK